MQFLAIALALAASAVPAFAHVEMSSPPPLRSTSNSFVTEELKDYTLIAPLNADGSNFPCKGYLSDIGTPQGASVITYKAGSSASFTLKGSAVHNGGSGQISLSADSGKTFKVIKTFLGNFPRNNGGNNPDPNQTYDFEIPSDAPNGDIVLSWSWLNNQGNREFYQDCAIVTIEGGSDSKSSLSSLPDMFVANVNNGCSTTEGSDVNIPNPGKNVEKASGAKFGEPVGDCAKGGSSPVADPAPTPDAPSSTTKTRMVTKTRTHSATSTAAPTPAPSADPAPPRCNKSKKRSSKARKAAEKKRAVSGSRHFGRNNAGNLLR